MSKTSTVALQQYEDYCESYAQVGDLLMDLRIIHEFPLYLANLLPQNYKAVNLGSCDGKDTDLIVAQCRVQKKEGEFINVDPYITRPNVLKITSDQFIEKCQSNSLDLILLKFSFHFNKDHSVFFKHAHRCLKESGKVVLLQIGNKCHLPWSKTIQKKFIQELPLAKEHIPHELFSIDHKFEQKTCKSNKEAFRQFVRQRGWSNLLNHSEEEINQSLKEIDEMKEHPTATLNIWLFDLTKKKI